MEGSSGGSGLEAMLEGLGIRAPRLEDAGLEDCALPPESIMDAFSRAAASLKSRILIGQEDDDDGGCVQDPGPTDAEVPDALLGAASGSPTGCGGARDFADGREDEVVVVGSGEGEVVTDRVLVLGGDGREFEVEGKKACPVDGIEGGLEGVLGGEKGKGGDGGSDGDGDGERDRDESVLIEAVI